jgi:AraC-like DNA-binding protein
LVADMVIVMPGEFCLASGTCGPGSAVAWPARFSAYLTRWRMDLAARRLRDTDDSLEAIAQSVGYTSVYAFSRAFSHIRSRPPGQYRSKSRAQAQSTPRPPR